MPQSTEDKIALSLFKEGDQGTYITGSFMRFLSDLQVAAIRGEPVPPVVSVLVFVHQDIWNIATIAQRLDWQIGLKRQGNLSDYQWMTFAAVDIDHFHVEFRSLFDYLAQLLQRLANKPGQVTQGSFEELRNWLKKSEKNQKGLGQELANLIVKCDWFGDIRTVRDNIVHKGGFTIVFPNEPRIAFQVQDGLRPIVLAQKKIMLNNNVVDFELYAGLYFAKLLAFLEELAEPLKTRVNLPFPIRDTRSYHPGFAVLKSWISRLSE